MADQHYPEVWAEIFILPCACLLLPYSFSKCLMMTFPFQSNVLIFMPCSEHPFCHIHLIKPSCKSNVLPTVLLIVFILCQVGLQHSQEDKHTAVVCTEVAWFSWKYLVYTGRLARSCFLVPCRSALFQWIKSIHIHSIKEECWYTENSCFCLPVAQ